MTDEILDLYEFNRWANLRVLDACAAVPEDELSRDMRSSFPSVLATLSHVVTAEWLWLERWHGRSHAGPPDDWEHESLAAIRSRCDQVWSDQQAYLENLSDEVLGSRIAYRNTRGEEFEGTLWQLARHVVNHSTYHRGQVITMLRQLGHAVPATDLVLYFRTVGDSHGRGLAAKPPSDA